MKDFKAINPNEIEIGKLYDLGIRFDVVNEDSKIFFFDYDHFMIPLKKIAGRTRGCFTFLNRDGGQVTFGFSLDKNKNLKWEMDYVFRESGYDI
jgi:hypothetical protein